MIDGDDNCGNDYEMAGAPEAAAYDTGKPFSISVPYGNQLHYRRHHCHLKASIVTHIFPGGKTTLTPPFSLYKILNRRTRWYMAAICVRIKNEPCLYQLENNS